MRKISDFNNATEKYPVIYAGSATRPEYVDMPTVLQQQEGTAPMDTLPAQWWNAMWKLATKDINAFRDYVGNAITEINNLLTKFNITLDDADSEQLYDFFHDDYVQSYLNNIFVNVTGDTIDGDLHIKGDLSVDGIGEEVISTELKVGANTITLRDDNPSALGNTELAGIVTENYDGNNHNNIIAVNKSGEVRTGDIDIATRILYSSDGTNFFTDEELTTPATIGANEEVRDTGNHTTGGVEIYEGVTYSNDDTEPLLTRAESDQIPNGSALVWDAANERAIAGSTSGITVITTATTTISNIPLSDNSAIKIMFTADISDSNTPGGTIPFEITYNNVSIPVKANKNGSLVSVFANEVQTNVWKYLQAYTTLEMVYMSDYDGLGNSAFIILGNPILLSGTGYTIYADGYNNNEKVSWTSVTDTVQLSNMNPATSNAVAKMFETSALIKANSAQANDANGTAFYTTSAIYQWVAPHDGWYTGSTQGNHGSDSVVWINNLEAVRLLSGQTSSVTFYFKKGDLIYWSYTTGFERDYIRYYTNR